MGNEVPLELTVSEEAAKAALQRDDLDAPELFAKLDFLIQVYDILDTRMNPQTNEELREILLLLNEDINLPPGDAGMVLSSLGVVEDTGQGWTTTD